jgi:predicted MFS family arabinose efflux permease
MSTTTANPPRIGPTRHGAAALAAFPLGNLLTLAAGAGFLTMLAETIRKDCWPQVHAGRGVSVAYADQRRTVYAAGSMLAAIPLTELMRGLARHNPLLPALTAPRSNGWSSPRENADDDD